MWGIPIVLIGGAYWVYKFIDEKANEEVAQKFQENADEINQKITASRAEEEYIKNVLKSNGSRWDALNSISSELRQIYGTEWKKYFIDLSNFESEYTMIYFPWGKAYHLLLSKSGKIPSLFAAKYQLGGVGDERMKYIIKTCQCIEKNIQLYYPELRILFVPGKQTYVKDGCKFYSELSMGSLHWEHNIPHRNKKWNPEIKSLW